MSLFAESPRSFFSWKLRHRKREALAEIARWANYAPIVLESQPYQAPYAVIS